MSCSTGEAFWIEPAARILH